MVETVTAEIPYTIDTGEKLVNETFGSNNIRRRRTGTLDWRRMNIEDGRPFANEFSIDRNGFMLVEHRTAVKDFFDKPIQSNPLAVADARSVAFDDPGTPAGAPPRQSIEARAPAFFAD